MIPDQNAPSGDPGPPKKYTTIDGYLMDQANDAIGKGADPKAVTQRLGEYVQYLRSNPELHAAASDAISRGADPAAVADRINQRRATSGSGAGRDFDADPTASAATDPLNNAARVLLHGATFGYGDELTAGVNAAADAASAALHGGSFHDTFGPAYDQRVAAERAALAKTKAAHPVASFAGEVAGGALPLVLSGGTSALATGGRLAKLGQAAKLGAETGFLTGTGDAEGGAANRLAGGAQGAAVGAVVGPLAHLGGSVVGTVASKIGIPQAASRLAQAGANVLPDDNPVAVQLSRVAQATGRRGQAAAKIGQRMQMDAAAGIAPKPAPPGIPSMALDQAAPEGAVEGLAEQIASKPGEGRTILTNAIRSRQAQMRPSVTRALESGTGVPADAGLSPQMKLIAAKDAQAKTLYGAARQATAGQPVQSPTLNAIMQTPTGKSAYLWALARKMDQPGAELPKGVAGVDINHPLVQQMVEMGIPADKAIQAVGSQVGDQTLPDPEIVHLMKRFLASRARIGSPVDGKTAAEAQTALSLWKNIRSELPAPWRTADLAYADKMRLIDAMDQGRNIYRAGTNPAGPANRAIPKSLDAVEQRVTAMSPEQQQAFRTGAGIAAHSRMGDASFGTQSPGRIFASSPAVERQTAAAFPTPGAAAQFQNVVSAWDAAQQRANRLLGNSRTALRMGEQGADAPIPGVASNLIRGNVGNALAAVGQNLNGEAESAAQRRVHAEIARLLTGSNPLALQQAQGAYGLRLSSADLLRRLLTGSAGAQGAQQAVSP